MLTPPFVSILQNTRTKYFSVSSMLAVSIVVLLQGRNYTANRDKIVCQNGFENTKNPNKKENKLIGKGKT